MFNGYQTGYYDPNAQERTLSHVDNAEDPIAQAMGYKQEQKVQETYRNDVVYNTERKQPVKPVQQIKANNKTISISISPDGTITITIGD